MIFYTSYEYLGVQLCMYPFEVMGISQNMYATPSHMDRPAIDDAGRDTGKCVAGAPYDARILWKKPFGSKTGILITNTRPVLCSDYSLHEPYTANALFWHDDDTSDLEEGMIIKQGTPFYSEGTADNATGNHVHMMVSFGKWDGEYPMDFLPKWGTYTLKNAVEPPRFFFVNDTIIRRSGGYNWVEFKAPEAEVPTQYLRKETRNSLFKFLPKMEVK